MTVVVYPHTFADGPGNTASGAQVMDNFNAVKGTVDAGIADAENAFGTYKDLPLLGSGIFSASESAGTYVLGTREVQALPVAFASPASAVVPSWFLYFDKADWAAGSRTTKLRIRAQTIVSGAAPACNFAFGLYAVTGVGSGSNVPTITSLGSVVSGSAIAINTPGSGGATAAAGSDFVAPAAGLYVIAVVSSAATAASSVVLATARLQMRQV